MLDRNYPTPPMSAIPTVLLESFQAEIAIDQGIGPSLNEVETQRVYALYAGARERATSCGGLRGHDMQAAAMLIAIAEFDTFLDGGLTIGAREGLNKKLDDDEMRALQFVRRVMVDLLDWHFQNGAGRLLPLADWLGLVRKEG